MSKVDSTTLVRVGKQFRRVKHGECRNGVTTLEYRVWKKMRDRCTNSNNEYWRWYGGKGIKVCRRWVGLNGFTNFLNDVGRAPSPQHTLDRRRSGGNYTPSNCRWATRLEQARNTSRNINITHDGRTQCVQAWLDEFGIPKSTYLSRFCIYGWDRVRAATTPPRRTARP